jgi:hypothetical protein
MSIRFYTSIQNLRNGLDKLDHRNICNEGSFVLPEIGRFRPLNRTKNR